MKTAARTNNSEFLNEVILIFKMTYFTVFGKSLC